MDRRSFLTRFLQTLSGLVLAGASFFTLKTHKYITPLSFTDDTNGTLIALPPGWQSCPNHEGPCDPSAQALVCLNFDGPCTDEVTCNNHGHVPCHPEGYYDPVCPGYDACPCVTPAGNQKFECDSTTETVVCGIEMYDYDGT